MVDTEGEMTNLGGRLAFKCVVTWKWIINKSNQTWKRDLIIEQKINVCEPMIQLSVTCKFQEIKAKPLIDTS